MKTFKGDIVIVGSGGAGLAAAIEAARSGKKVIVVSKLNPGAATSTAVSNSSFRNSGLQYTKEQHYQDTLQTGLGLNEVDLVKTLVDNGAEDLESLKDFGVPLKAKSSGSYCDGPLPFARGVNIVRPLIDEAKRLGVEFVYPYFIWDIVVDDDKVVGAWGFEKGSGELAVFVTNVIILATGGAGAIYDRTDNTPSITGDGYAMAARLGLPLIDMEFVQFYPLFTAFDDGRKDAFLTPIIGEVAPLLNNRGEELSEKYNIERPLAVKSRDLTCHALMLEKETYLDFTNVTEDDWEKAAQIFDRNNAILGRSWLEKKYFKTTKKIPIKPVNHFFMGGVPINSWGATPLKGLLAAGEVTGGLHGANRLEGNALTEIFVFGKRAGLKGVMVHNDYGSIDEKEDLVIQTALKNVRSLEDQGEPTKFEDVIEGKQKLKKIMWQGAGIIRNSQSLEDVLAQIEEMKSTSVKIGSRIVDYLEFKNMLLIGEIITRAALYRTETRGSHYRTDFPKKDDLNWQYHSFLTMKNGQISLKRIKPNQGQ